MHFRLVISAISAVAALFVFVSSASAEEYACVSGLTSDDPTLNLRSKPSTAGKILAKLPNDTPLVVFEREGRWSRVQPILKSRKLELGWVASRYTTASKTLEGCGSSKVAAGDAGTSPVKKVDPIEDNYVPTKGFVCDGTKYFTRGTANDVNFSRIIIQPTNWIPLNFTRQYGAFANSDLPPGVNTAANIGLNGIAFDGSLGLIYGVDHNFTAANTLPLMYVISPGSLLNTAAINPLGPLTELSTLPTTSQSGSTPFLRLSSLPLNFGNAKKLFAGTMVPLSSLDLVGYSTNSTEIFVAVAQMGNLTSGTFSQIPFKY